MDFPPELKPRKITNPDAPRNDHCLRIEVEGVKQWAIPILYSSEAKYDVKRGGEFFNYVRFQLLLVERDQDDKVKPLMENGAPRLVEMANVPDFFEQVGRNAREIFHPEEILADNFALLVTGTHLVPSPKVIEHLEQALKKWKRAP